MKAAYYEQNGEARDVLKVGEVKTPEPGPGEVRVRLHTSGVNPSDIKMRMGRARKSGPWPQIIPHSDGAGIVDKLGPEGEPASASGHGHGSSTSSSSARASTHGPVPESRLASKSGQTPKEGDRVWVHNGQWQRPFGTAAEYICLPRELVTPLPDNVGFEEGACLGIPALTAWHAVTFDGDISGETVLVPGGAGSVGHYVVQFAKLKGARVIITISSPEKAEHARRAGADETINYREEDVPARLAELTDGNGVDRIIEVNLSSNAPLISKVLGKNGTVVVYGSDEPIASIPAGHGIVNAIRYLFFIIYDVPLAQRLAAIKEITGLMKAGQVIHTVAHRFPLDEIVKAHEAVEQGSYMGNVVLEIE